MGGGCKLLTMAAMSLWGNSMSERELEELKMENDDE
jgi:hypothetical protein